MADLQTLRALQQRIRDATGPDRGLDLEICMVFEQRMAWVGDLDGLGSPHYTFDPDGLGACVALMREVLPGWWWSIEASGGQEGTGKTIYHARVWGAESAGQRAFGITAYAPNFALLLATVTAKIAEEKAREAV